MGFNYHGIIKNNPNFKNYTKELEEQLFLEQLEKKRKRRKWNFSKILGDVNPKEYPWEF
jgi:hypothetical protein